MTTLLIPSTAAVFPPNFGPVSEDYQSATLSEIVVIANSRNSVASGIFASACADWTAANTQHRDYALPLTAKPVAPLGQVAHSAIAQSGDTISFLDANGLAMAPPMQAAQGPTLYVWVAEDGAPVGPPCPDLPALPSTVPGHVHVGVRLAGDYFRKCIDDTIPTGGKPVLATSDDGVYGQFLPTASEMGTNNPFLGWYLKVA